MKSTSKEETVKFKMILTIEANKKEYMEIKEAIESGHFQREIIKDGAKSITATIDKL